MFLCRDSELEKLNKRYKANNFECIIIYGRRRVGKTALINEFSKDKRTIYFSALEATADENLVRLSQSIHLLNNKDNKDAPIYTSFDAALDAITEINKEEKTVFVIDEYPYLAKAYPSISSRLQHLIDYVLSESNIFVILCGSSMSFMENQVLGYQSPLYGRRTGQFKIEPLSYKDTALFYPKLSAKDQALLYGITGGVPHYIKKLNIKNSIDDALLENFFDRSAYLFEEPENLLKQELREPAIYNAIISAIAEGASRLNEIATKAKLESGACSKYIKILINLGIIKKEIPIGEKNSRKSIYLLADQFFRFWYKFVPNNLNTIINERISLTYKDAIKPKLTDYMGLVFEKMSRAYLAHYATKLPFEILEIGQWWGPNPKTKEQIQIDIIATSSNKKEDIIGSCKFRNEKVGLGELTLLKNYGNAYNEHIKHHYYIFSKAGFTEELLARAIIGEVTLVTLEEMYG